MRRVELRSHQRSADEYANAVQFRPVTVGLLVALVWIPGKASDAQCGSTAAGFEAWKRQFAGEAQARSVSASTIAALMAGAS
jgi:hypothetical protein